MLPISKETAESPSLAGESVCEQCHDQRAACVGGRFLYRKFCQIDTFLTLAIFMAVHVLKRIPNRRAKRFQCPTVVDA
jgi:hypothetical protein